jgi:hypothetical protein
LGEDWLMILELMEEVIMIELLSYLQLIHSLAAAWAVLNTPRTFTSNTFEKSCVVSLMASFTIETPVF